MDNFVCDWLSMRISDVGHVSLSKMLFSSACSEHSRVQGLANVVQLVWASNRRHVQSIPHYSDKKRSASAKANASGLRPSGQQ